MTPLQFIATADITTIRIEERLHLCDDDRLIAPLCARLQRRRTLTGKLFGIEGHTIVFFKIFILDCNLQTAFHEKNRFLWVFCTALVDCLQNWTVRPGCHAGEWHNGTGRPTSHRRHWLICILSLRSLIGVYFKGYTCRMRCMVRYMLFMLRLSSSKSRTKKQQICFTTTVDNTKQKSYISFKMVEITFWQSSIILQCGHHH